MESPITQRKTLRRSLGLWSVTIISLSAMLGSGLFVLPAFAYDMVGPGMWIAYLLAASVVLPGALSKSELSTSMPVSGGSYVFVERTFGPLIGTITGLGLWVSFLLKASFALIGFSAYLTVLTSAFDLPVIDIRYVAVSFLIVIVLINILGMKKIKAVQTPVVGVSVLMLMCLSVWALFREGTDLSAPLQMVSFNKSTWSLVLTAAFVLVSYAGVTKIAAVAEEVKDPGKNLPRGILLSLLISSILYSSVLYIMASVLEPGQFYNEAGQPREDIIFVFAQHIGGAYVGYFAAVMAIITMISMSIAGIMAASRYPFAMARDSLLPSALEDVHPTYETPRNTIMLTGIIMLFSILFLPVHDIAKLASGFQIMVFVLINLCVLILRRSMLSNAWYHPEYKSPLYPYVQIYGMGAGLVLLIAMGFMAFVGASCAILMGTLLYVNYGKHHAHPINSPWKVLWKRMSKDSEADTMLWRSVFQACDEGGKGHLNLTEFRKAMHVLENEMDDEDLRNFWHQIDTNQDGIIDIESFLDALRIPENIIDDTDELPLEL